MTWISDIIRGRGGAIPFSEFMTIALYHPVRGYYSRSRTRYGRKGDFLTAPTASQWYARVFSHALEGISNQCGPLVLVDLAAGDGSFLEATLDALNGSHRETVARVIAVEQSAAMRRQSEIRLGSHAVEHHARLERALSPEGAVVIHACELYDALPVDRVIGAAGGRMLEYWVAAEGERLAWEHRPVRPEVEAYFDGHGVALAEGQIAESSRQAAQLHTAHLEWAGAEGVAFVLDYGYESARLYDPRGRAQGSLACYSRHEMSRDALQRPGEQDLTAHVNWDDLRSAAGEMGWHEHGMWPLAEFLVRAGLADVIGAHGLGPEAELDAATFSERQEIKRLLDPEGMGSDLKVLIQGRGRIGGVAAEVLGV